MGVLGCGGGRFWDIGGGVKTLLEGLVCYGMSILGCCEKGWAGCCSCGAVWKDAGRVLEYRLVSREWVRATGQPDRP